MSEDFIYVAENAVTKELCDEIIEDADKIFVSMEGKEGTDFYCDSSSHFDNALDRDDQQLFSPRILGNWYQLFLDVTRSHFREAYSKKFSTLSYTTLVNSVAKIQKTKPKGGFSAWHFEQNAGDSNRRCLVWMLYLNDVDEGGTTEFIYQGKIIKPKAGTFVMWPAGFTHTHRGNPPYSNTKYIVTGWLVYPDIELPKNFEVKPDEK